MTNQSTYGKIVSVAEKFVRTRGYNGFSYADVAAEVGVSKASLHHHFATKPDLGLELIRNFTKNVSDVLEEIDYSNQKHLTKLREYARMYEGSFHENKMCLCGMLAAEHESLSDPMRKATIAFFEGHEVWLEKVLIAGKEAGELQFNGPAIDQARLIVANLQGALLVAKAAHSLPRITAVASNLIESYRVKEIA